MTALENIFMNKAVFVRFLAIHQNRKPLSSCSLVYTSPSGALSVAGTPAFL